MNRLKFYPKSDYQEGGLRTDFLTNLNKENESR